MAERPRAVVLDLWFTLVSPDDFRPRGQHTRSEVALRLGLDPEAFDVYWGETRQRRMATPRTMRSLVTDFAASQGRTLDAEELRTLDEIWAAHDRALAEPRAATIRGLDEQTAGWVTSTQWIAGGAGAALGGWVCDRLCRRHLALAVR